LFFPGLLEFRKDRVPDGRIFLGLQRIAADHQAPLTRPDFFDLQIGLNLLIPSSLASTASLIPFYRRIRQPGTEANGAGSGSRSKPGWCLGDHAAITATVT
jgi:hypothetical protein